MDKTLVVVPIPLSLLPILTILRGNIQESQVYGWLETVLMVSSRLVYNPDIDTIDRKSMVLGLVADTSKLLNTDSNDFLYALAESVRMCGAMLLTHNITLSNIEVVGYDGLNIQILTER